MPDRKALTGILFVFKSDIPWEMRPQEMGCGSGMTCWRRLRDWHEAGVWVRLHRVLLNRLGEADQIDWSRAALEAQTIAAPGVGKGGALRRALRRAEPDGSWQTGHEAPSCGRPTRDAPLTFRLSGANTHDSKVFEELIDAVPAIGRPRGRPRKRPEKLHADRGYDFPRCRRALTRRRIKVRIARRGKESSERLGRHRWVVERTLAWLSRFRRLRVRYERRLDIHEAFVQLGCALITWDAVIRFC